MLKSKSNTESDKYRCKGNELFDKKRMLQALKFYNAALNHAENKEKQALAYANRSAVYLFAKKYEECLINIKWARENNYPADRVLKLNEREEKCKKLMEKEVKDPSDDPMEFFKLSYPPNPKIPFIVNCLEFHRINNEPRLFTNRDLKPGDLIFKDTMAFTRVNVIAQYFRCCLCSKTNMMNLIPCLRSASLMFCSVECRDKTYELYGDSLSDMLVEDEMLTLNNRFWTDVQNAFGGKDKFLKFMKKNNICKMKKTTFDFDWRKDPEKTRIICCVTMDTRHAAPMYEQQSFKNFNHKPLLKQFGKKTLTVNGTFCQGLSSKIDGFKSKLEGFGFVLFHVNARISCIPNVETISINNEVYGFVVRHIKAGEEILMTKNIHAFDFDTAQEKFRHKLNSAIKMYCHPSCFGCNNNILRGDFKHTFGLLSLIDAQPYAMLSRCIVIDTLNGINMKDVKEITKENWKVMQRYGHEILSREAVAARDRVWVILLDLIQAILFPVARQ